MSYWYPTQEEAESQYYYNRRQYYNASIENRNLQRQKDACIDQRRRLSNNRQTLQSNKINFEERLRGIDKIIRKLEGTGMFFSSNVPSTIEKADRAMNVFEDGYRRSMRVDGIPAADVRRAFAVQTVEGNRNSANALAIYIRKYQELSESIENIKRQIADMDRQMGELQRKVTDLSNQQWNMSRLMNSSLFNMEHFRPFM